MLGAEVDVAEGTEPTPDLAPVDTPVDPNEGCPPHAAKAGAQAMVETRAADNSFASMADFLFVGDPTRRSSGPKAATRQSLISHMVVMGVMVMMMMMLVVVMMMMILRHGGSGGEGEGGSESGHGKQFLQHLVSLP